MGEIFNQFGYDNFDLFFRGGSAPPGFEVGLFDDIPEPTDGPNDLMGEPVGSGYSRQPLARNSTDIPTISLDAGHYKAVSKEVLFTASGGNWPPVSIWAVFTTSTPKRLVAWDYLSAARQVFDGQSLGVVVSLKQSS